MSSGKETPMDPTNQNTAMPSREAMRAVHAHDRFGSRAPC